jgi:hypothetical protein
VGVFSVRVTVTLARPQPETASATSLARVGKPARHQLLARARGIRHPVKTTIRPAKPRIS